MVNIQELDNFNNKWKELITKDFSPTPFLQLKQRYENGKGAIINDPFFTSFKDKKPEEQQEMLKSIDRMYKDDKMTYAEGSITNNQPDLLAIFHEYRQAFLDLVDGKTEQLKKYEELEKWVESQKDIIKKRHDYIMELETEKNQLKVDKENIQKNYEELLAKVDKTDSGTQLENEYIEIKVPLILKDVPSEL